MAIYPAGHFFSYLAGGNWRQHLVLSLVARGRCEQDRYLPQMIECSWILAAVKPDDDSILNLGFKLADFVIKIAFAWTHRLSWTVHLPIGLFLRLPRGGSWRQHLVLSLLARDFVNKIAFCHS